MTHRPDLLDLANRLNARLDEMPAYEGVDWAEAHERRRRDVAELKQSLEAYLPCFIIVHGDGVIFKMGGLRATSTSGLVGACRNWIAQAQRKAEAS